MSRFSIAWDRFSKAWGRFSKARVQFSKSGDQYSSVYFHGIKHAVLHMVFWQTAPHIFGLVVGCRGAVFQQHCSSSRVELFSSSAWIWSQHFCVLQAIRRSMPMYLTVMYSSYGDYNNNYRLEEKRDDGAVSRVVYSVLFLCFMLRH